MRFYMVLVASYFLHIFCVGRWATAELSWLHIHQPAPVRNVRPSLAAHEAGSRLEAVQQCCATGFCASKEACKMLHCTSLSSQIHIDSRRSAPGSSAQSWHILTEHEDNLICSPTACKRKVKAVVCMLYKTEDQSKMCWAEREKWKLHLLMESNLQALTV